MTFDMNIALERYIFLSLLVSSTLILSFISSHQCLGSEESDSIEMRHFGG